MLQDWCVASLGCGWCPADNTCYERSRGARCTNNLQTYDCPGLCPALHSCQSCLVHGAPCSWCVQAGRCTGRDQAAGGWPGRCGAEAPLNWWGGLTGEVQAAGDCRGQDRRPGITLVRHYPPVDPTRPDAVALLNHSWADLSYREEFSGALPLLPRGPATTLLTAFLHTPQAGADRGLALEAKAANASLWVSGSEGGEGRELVAQLAAGRLEAGPGKEAAVAKRPGGGKVLVPGGRQLIEAKAWVDPGAAGHLSLSWAGADRGTLSYRHLEPYSRGGAACLPHDTCLGCLTDALCQWCPGSATCLPRDDPKAVCLGGAGSGAGRHFPVLDIGECHTCEQHIYCSACVGAGCEWLPDKAHCSRRGRFTGAITLPHACPAPCHRRPTCATCLGVPGRCAWCSETQVRVSVSLSLSLIYIKSR
ncbi:Multiple epidermal growth factor-like domains protein 8 [Portunus trituberculatus]|uniref:Multiple epidermal growth factor-like domains protein 8 n=1 Tax=Portunus trituberculatus TaxID=210409 RepID=A0A5B7HTF9_PORTR|nr:Multiple epidermal growth factor-like domains protein 8 [Portunus trituberculatus]